MRTSTKHRILAPITLVGALALSGCNEASPASFEDQPTQQAAPQQTAPQESGPAQTGQPGGQADTEQSDTAQSDTEQATEDGTSAESAAAAGVNLLEIGEPIATITTPAVVEDDPEATMDVSLYGLERDGNTLVATYSFRVNSESDDQRPRWIYHYLGDAPWVPFLVDTTNLTRHDVPEGEGFTRPMTASQGAMFRPGTTFYAYATFAAPPEGVTSMTVHLVDGAPGVPDVPIQ